MMPEMKNEYIDRSKISESISRVVSGMKEKASGDRVQVAAIGLVERTRDYIANFPTEDVAPVVHAHWETWAGSLRKCSACGYEYTDLLECNNYCGNCGAKMDEGAPV